MISSEADQRSQSILKEHDFTEFYRLLSEKPIILFITLRESVVLRMRIT